MKHIYISHVTAKAGSTVSEAILDAISFACENQCDVKLVHNDNVYKIKPFEIVIAVEKTAQNP